MKKFILFMVLLSISSGTAGETVRFAVLGARTGEPVEDVFSDIVDQVSLLCPDLVLNTGNLVEAEGADSVSVASQWDDVLDMMAVLTCDLFLVPGSNDITGDAAREIYERKTGRKRFYSFDYGPCHFVVLDNSITAWNPLHAADPEQYAWFVGDLEQHKAADHIFVFCHTPLYLITWAGGEADPFMQTCLQYGVRAVFSGGLGHYMYLNEGNVDYITVGSSGAAMRDNDAGKGNFHHFLYVTVKGDVYNAAVIRHGGVLYRNVFTASDYYTVQRAQREVIAFGGTTVREGERNVSCRCQMTVSNASSDSVTGSLVWEYDAARYTIKPAATELKLGPEESRVYDLSLKVSDGSRLYPLPTYTMEYPYTFGKVCTLNSVLSIKRVKRVGRVKSPPAIDGVLNDPAWVKVEPITHLGDDEGLISGMESTEIYLAHDDDNVYLAARCSESDTSTIRVSVQERDGPTYRDDNIWFFFDVDNDMETYYQLIVNPDGVIFDRSCNITDGRLNTVLEWNGPWEIKSGREQNAWTLEMRIPKNELVPYSDKRWGFNFRRLQTSTASAAYWSLPFGHTPGNFGIIEFE